jgi:hypothetical protein
MPDRAQAEAISVFVSPAGDVYVAGQEIDEKWINQPWHGPDVIGWDYFYHATVWKNGEPLRLASMAPAEDGRSGYAFAWSVFVSEADDVYVVGEVGHRRLNPDGRADYRGHAMLWKNGVGEALGVGDVLGGRDTYDISARSVSVSPGGDVYVAGYVTEPITGQDVAVLWTNGVPQRLSQARHSAAWSVLASGDDVYVAGQEGDEPYDWGTHAMLWTNGVGAALDDGPLPTIAASVFVSGGDVYVVGPGANERYNNVGILWKNGARRDFTDGNKGSQVYSVYVHDGAWYAAGIETDTALGFYWNYVPMLWVNGSPRRLSNSHGRASSVFVTDPD